MGEIWIDKRGIGSVIECGIVRACESTVAGLWGYGWSNKQSNGRHGCFIWRSWSNMHRMGELSVHKDGLGGAESHHHVIQQLVMREMPALFLLGGHIELRDS